MSAEFNALQENNTWSLVNRPTGKNILKCRWVFKVKRHQDGSIDKYKARLVARGDQQLEGVDFDEVFAPVARLDAIRTLLASSVVKGMQVHQMDVMTAYIQGDLKDEIYMEQPQMFVKSNEREKVCKLNKPLYGLKQAGREWYHKLNDYLTKLKFKRTAVNPCVYVDTKEGSDSIIIVYVDDLLIASASSISISNIKNALKVKFKIRDLGCVKDILGMHVDRDGVGDIKISQRMYIQDVLERFGMVDCNPTSIPMEQNLDITKLEEETKLREDEKLNEPYRELIGCLNYLSNATRPDIAFATNLLSRFCVNPKLIHWKMAKRVLRYLKGTIDYGINYSNSEKSFVGYVDADWAGDNSDRRSCTGYVVCIAGGPVSWKCKKQKSVALSTMEAEYMALSELTKEVIYMRNLLDHMKIYDLIKDATRIKCDNQSAIQLCKYSVYHARSKHIDIRYHFSREAQERGDIEVGYLNTNEMPADMLTKPLTKDRHVYCAKLLNLLK